jgi:signal transduction histidine kinase
VERGAYGQEEPVTIAAVAGKERRVLPNVPAVLALAALGAAATAATVSVVARSPVLENAAGSAALRGLFVASYIAVGTYTWWRRPDSRLGLLVAGAGFLYALTSFNAAESSGAYTFGRVVLAGFVVYLVYVFLSFPYERLRSRLERRFMAAFTVATVLLWALALALTHELPAPGPFVDCGNRCPDNAVGIGGVSNGVSEAVGFLVTGVTALALGVVVVLLLQKARSPARLRRRAIAPLLYSVIALAISYGAFTILSQAEVNDVEWMRVIAATSALAIPFALFTGQVWGRIFVANRLGQLVAQVRTEAVSAAQVETLMRDALGDPALTLALWSPDGGPYVGVDGTRVELPADSQERTVTLVQQHGQPMAALIHDPSLEVEPGVVEGLAVTSLMLLENTQLLGELRASRARLVATAQRERLRLERNLHDGAQQRLMTLQIKLAQARERAGDDGLAAELDQIAEDAAAAVEELRVLAHGIYPTVLRERGLADALGSLADSAPIAVRVVDHSIGRCTPTVEEAVYFCVLEAMQNAIKHGGGNPRITITLELREDELAFAVADDGDGFEPLETTSGFGFTSMQDRIGAVEGVLEILSSPGQDTVIRGTVPVAGARASE